MKSGMEHINTLNSTMASYAGLINHLELLKRQYPDESVKNAVKVLEEHKLKEIRDKWMEIQTEIHTFLNQFDK
jgi:hypothetical protein